MVEGERPQFASVTVTVFWRFDELTVAYTVRAMHGLDFSVSPAKSEAIWFYDKRWKGTLPPGLCINIAGEAIEMGSQISFYANVLCDMLPKIDGVGVQCANCTRGYPISGPVWSRSLHLFVREIFQFPNN